MTAAEARLIAANAMDKKDAEREIRIRTAVNKILKEIREVASNGGREMVYSPSGLTYMVDVVTVKHRFEELGYTISERDGAGWEIISW